MPLQRDLHPVSGVADVALDRPGSVADDRNRLGRSAKALEPPGDVWIYQPVNGLPLDIRSEPIMDGPRASSKLRAEETFRVSEVVDGADGILYLKLADGRGWVFNMKPGVGNMCWIVGEDHGTKALPVLPPSWTAHRDGEDQLYYANASTGESRWELPLAVNPPAVAVVVDPVAHACSQSDPAKKVSTAELPSSAAADLMLEKRRALMQRLANL